MIDSEMIDVLSLSPVLPEVFRRPLVLPKRTPGEVQFGRGPIWVQDFWVGTSTPADLGLKIRRSRGTAIAELQVQAPAWKKDVHSLQIEPFRWSNPKSRVSSKRTAFAV